tara:strand:+ start:1324 stop:1947 length:624 start_codon:yes stop_codon:yes gene_type:complete
MIQALTNKQINDFEQICNIVTKNIVQDILAEVDRKISILEREFGNLKDEFGTKMASELCSKAFEKAASLILSESIGSKVTNPKTDNDPDLFFESLEIPLEVKMTAGQSFLGGEFSKRPSSHLLVARDADNKKNFFVALALLSKEDWKSGGANFYGTTIDKQKMLSLKEEGRLFVLMGSLEPKLTKAGQPYASGAVDMKKDCYYLKLV